METKLILYLMLFSAGLTFGEPKVGPTPLTHGWSIPGGGRFVTALALDAKGGVWCGSEDAGVRYFDGLWWKAIKTPYGDEYPLAILPDGSSTIFGWSRSGISILKPDGTWIHENMQSGFAGHRVNALFRDKEKTIWAGTDRGLWRWNATWEYVPLSAAACRRSKHTKIASVLEVTSIAEWNGGILAGTAFHGLWQVNGGSLEPFEARGLPDQRVFDLLSVPGPDAAKEHLWVATFAGAAVLDPENTWLAVPFPTRELTPQQILSSNVPQSRAVMALSWDPRRIVWMATRSEGVFGYRPEEGKWRIPGLSRGYSGSFVRSVVAGRNGLVYAGGYQSGLALFEAESLRYESRGEVLEYANSLVESSRGWTYNDRRHVQTVSAFIYGRRLRKVQTDEENRFFCLYFSGPERANRIEKGQAVAADFEGAVLLSAATGCVIWSTQCLLQGQVRWDAAGRVLEESGSRNTNLRPLSICEFRKSGVSNHHVKPSAPAAQASRDKGGPGPGGPAPENSKALQTGERPIGTMPVSVERVRFYFSDRNRFGTVQDVALDPVSALFDGNLKTQAWKTPKNLVGWTMEINLGKPCLISGLVLIGTNGGWPEQVEALSLEARKEKDNTWEWVGAVSGRDELQGLLSKLFTTSKIRVGWLSPATDLSEIKILYSPAPAADERHRR